MKSVDALNARPNFFPGQMVDYRDFNRLASYPQTAVRDMLKSLFPGGGILFDVRDQFALKPIEGLRLCVQSGTAVLPTGEVAEMTEDSILDLSRFNGAGLVYVTIGNERVARDNFIDPEDTSISGFLSEAVLSNLQASTELPAAGRIEICRVTLSASNRVLTTEASNQREEAAHLDVSHRKFLLPQSAPDFSELSTMQTVLRSLDDSLRKLGKIFLIQEGSAHAAHLLSSLHAEVLALPQQPMKMGFLMSEFSRKLALFLETLDRQLPLSRDDLDRPRLLQTLGSLEMLHPFEPFRMASALERLTQVSASMSNIVRYAEERFSLFTVVEEAILALRDQALRVDAELPLAGQVFKKVDSIDCQMAMGTGGRVRFQSKEVQVRRMQARYANGDAFDAQGAFFRNGGIEIEFEVPKTDRPVVILIRHYVRRAQALVHYDVNGKTLVSESWEELRHVNQWMNRGLVVPSDRLVPGLNRLSLRVEKTDLDFGFFDMHVFQPGDLGRVN